MGYDVSLTRALIGLIKTLLASRAPPGSTSSILEGHRLIFRLAREQRWRSRRIGAVSAISAVRAHPGARRTGWGSLRIGTPARRNCHRQLGKGSFCATDRELITAAFATGTPASHRHALPPRGRMIAVSVPLLKTHAATDHGNYLAALKMVKQAECSGARSTTLIETIEIYSRRN